ncbi:KR domain-containing protein, partial [Corynebacterium striatum]
MLNAVGQAQHILLLGGTSEIGLGIVEEFLDRGPAKVTLAARADSPRIDDAKATLTSRGADVEVINFDATDFDSHPDVVKQ